MDKMMELAEQHIRESASRLKHIDELMARARSAPRQGSATDQMDSVLNKLQLDRDRLARELDDVQRMPRGDSHAVAKRSEGLRGVLEAVGLQLEQALTAVFDQGKP